MKPESVIYILKCCAVQKLWGCWATLKSRHKFADPPLGELLQLGWAKNRGSLQLPPPQWEFSKP